MCHAASAVPPAARNTITNAANGDVVGGRSLRTLAPAKTKGRPESRRPVSDASCASRFRGNGSAWRASPRDVLALENRGRFELLGNIFERFRNNAQRTP